MSDSADITSSSSSGVHLVSSDVSIGNGAVWTDTELGDGGELFVEDGGLAVNTLVDKGDLTVDAGGVASGVTVTGDWDENGYFEVDGGTITDLTVEKQGWGIVNSGSINNVLVTDSGYIEIAALADNVTVSNGGGIEVDSTGVVRNLTVGPGGTFGIRPGEGGVIESVTIASGGTINAADISSAGGVTIRNGGSIDFSGMAFQSGGSTTLEGDPVLTVTEGGVSRSVSIEGNYAGEHFVLSDDGAGGTVATLEPDDGTPCFCRGTLIETERGEIAVEDLAIGDRVRTASGALRPIRWIGHRSYSGPFVRGNRNVLPVIIRAGALGDGLPRRDLCVSPLHAMALEGVLIPAVCLINGISILQAERIDEVTYFHVELETHDILLAEGAPSESFVDDDSRNMFHNAAEFRRLYPDAAPLPAVYCAPRIEEGLVLEAIRARLNAEAGIVPVRISSGIVEGYLDEVTRTVIRGWARNPRSSEPMRLSLYDNGIAIGEVVADCPRPDVGSDCGFCFVVPGGFAPHMRHVIEIAQADDPGTSRNFPGHTPWILDQQTIGHHTIAQSAVPASSATMRGYIDSASRDRICGWICDPAQPGESLAIQVVVNGTIVERSVANGRRPDVADAGAGPERCGFDLLFIPPLSSLRRQIIEVRNERTGALLGQPVIVEAADQFDSDLEQVVRRAIGSVQDAKDHDRVLSFLAAQMERLKQSHADHQSGRIRSSTQRERSRRGLAPPENRSPSVLVIDSRMPDARRDAGSCAILSLMAALRALGYDISFVAADEMGSASTPTMENIEICGLPFYNSVEDLLRRQAQSFDLVYLHRQDIVTRYLPLVRQYQSKARAIYAVADLHHMRIARQAAVEERPELLAKARQVRDAEYAVARQADLVLTHSTVEAAILRRDVPGVEVHVVPWAVPVRKRTPAFDTRHGVLFLGNFSHAPNVDAAFWLAEEIMPLVWRQRPDIRCVIAGADMPEQIRRLAAPSIEVIGHVPDCGTLFDKVRLSIAPLRFGAGVKGKILDSLGAGVPCVMTPIAAEGMELPRDFTDATGETAEALAALIVSLHDDSTTHARMVQAGRRFIRERHDHARIIDALGRIAGDTRVKRQAG
ncbi:Hint domain-containing protein [Acetobacter senegalensis]|uniref:Hint domain-containing protein n=1 Tax=Acetobacter senegalensis TaxID=446692 RepID=UPI001EDB67E9|nr:Hint domain-containing protein [Acetobacter senegalensis]MCG4256549.1 Hint domain-containing protein [Acetobacter senegalensis]MCG4266455.1 Hint domain-containing protein [Acetobacter senegalensis]